jgi:1-acyl-sn-glycerol-3-phosphate acyltransferase
MTNLFRGTFAIFLYTFSFIICGLVIFLLAPLKLLPIAACQKWLHTQYGQIPTLWTQISNFIIKLTSQTEWIFQIDPKINRNESYILIANHQSWLDIIAIQKAINTLAPRPVYLMKRALLWVPVMGWTCWLLDFPFMHRLTKEYLKKHPEKQGLDLKLMQKSCQRYKANPVTFINFAEGTRFTEHKQKAQNAPYQNLLKPRGGGLAFTLNAMEDQIHHVLNATIIYSPPSQTLWQMLCLKRKKIIVDIRCLSVNETLRGDYQNDLAYRQAFQNWLNQIWQEKDQLIKNLLK